MEKCLIITNYDKDENLSVTKRIQKYLTEHGCECVVPNAPLFDLCEKEENNVKSDLLNDVEGIIVLGGDGTLIQAAHDTVEYNLPLLGINLGTLGYLTEIGKDNINVAMDALINDNYEIEERMMLEGQLSNGELCSSKVYLALNDIVINRIGGLRVVNYDIYINDKFLAAYKADGMIVSTPTGSTGYSMSAGGPIVAPCTNISVVTPICSHTLNNRSIVLDANDKISIYVESHHSANLPEAMVSFDAANSLEIEGGDCIEIRKSRLATKIIKINKDSFLQNLSKKMGL